MVRELEFFAPPKAESARAHLRNALQILRAPNELAAARGDALAAGELAEHVAAAEARVSRALEQIDAGNL
jgi:hypothetical protein